jgi:hypothetical protein
MEPVEAYLVVVRGDHTSATIQLRERTVRIGRANDNEIILNDKLASRLHAVISSTDRGHLLRDNRSRNGTYVNDRRIEEHLLQDFDEIRIGNIVLRYRLAATMANDETCIVPEAMPLLEVETNRIAAVRGRGGRVWWIAALLILVTAVAASAVILTWEPGGPAEVHELPYMFEAGRISLEREDPGRIGFTFEGRAGENVLRLRGWEISRADEVRVLLNGVEVGYLRPTEGGVWVEQSFRLPPSALRLGERNLLVLEHNAGGGADDLWAVSEVAVGDEGDLPCDREVARAAFEAALLLGERRAEQYANLYQAIETARLALDLARRCQPPPAFYGELQEFLESATRDLEEQVKAHFLQQDRLVRAGQREAAAREMQLVLAKIPDKTHPDHIRARNALIRLRSAMRADAP